MSASGGRANERSSIAPPGSFAGRYCIDWRRELATFLNSGQSSSVQPFAEMMSRALQGGAALFDPQSDSMADSAVRENRHPGVEDRQIVVLPQDIRQPVRMFATFLQLRGPKPPRDVDLVEQILHLFSPFVQAPVVWFVPYTPECPSPRLINPDKALADGGLIQLSSRDLAEPFLHPLQRIGRRREVLAQQSSADGMPLFLKLPGQRDPGCPQIIIVIDILQSTQGSQEHR